MIATAEEETSLFAFTGFQLHVLCTAAWKHALDKTLQMERVIVPAFAVFFEYDRLQHARTE